MRSLFLLFFIAASGVCTGVYVETGPQHIPGFIQQGDVFEFWCEVPGMVFSSEELRLRAIWGESSLRMTLFTPRVLLPGEMVLFP